MTKKRQRQRSKGPVFKTRKGWKEYFSYPHIMCLVCRRKFPALKEHLEEEHGMSEEDYREFYGVPSSFDLVAGGSHKTVGGKKMTEPTEREAIQEQLWDQKALVLSIRQCIADGHTRDEIPELLGITETT